MDDFEHPRVRFVRAPTTLYERRCARGTCPQCGGKKEGFQVYCGAACSARAEAHQPIQPPTEEEIANGETGKP